MRKKVKNQYSYHRDKATFVYKSVDSKNHSAFYCYVNKDSDPSMHFNGKTDYFFMDFLYRKIVFTVRVSLDDMNQIVNDYYIRKEKTIFRFAEPLVRSKLKVDDGLTDDEIKICDLACSTEICVDNFSSPQQILHENDIESIFSFLAKEVSGACFGGEYIDILTHFYYEVYLMEQEIYKGNKSFPIVVDDPSAHCEFYHELHVHHDHYFSLSYRPYRNYEENQTPWQLRGVRTTYKFIKNCFEDDDGDMIEDWDPVGGSKDKTMGSIDLTSEKMEEFINRVIYQLEKHGFAQPEKYKHENFEIPDRPSPRKMNRINKTQKEQQNDIYSYILDD